MSGLKLRKGRLLGAMYEADTTPRQLLREGFRVYHYIDNGGHLPRCMNMRRLCLRLNVSADYLLGSTDEKHLTKLPSGELPGLEERMVSLSVQKVPRNEYKRRYEAIKHVRQSRDLNLRTAQRIAEAHGCTVDYILGLEE